MESNATINGEKVMEAKVIEFVGKQLAIHCRCNSITTKEGITSAMNANKRLWVKMALSCIA